MAGAMDFKVTLIRHNQPPEIRRFEVRTNTELTYSDIKAKICATFPNLKPSEVTMFWRDGDGDMVAVGSEDELRVALRLMENEKCKKFQISSSLSSFSASTGHAAPGSQKGSVPKVIHDGVMCDSCDAGVVGYRYKCLSCADYDLCFDCEHKGVHHQHVMVRYPFPADRAYHFERKLKKMCKKFITVEDGNGRCSMSQPSHIPDIAISALVDEFLEALKAHENSVTPELINQIIGDLSDLQLGAEGEEKTSTSPCGRKNKDNKKKNKKRGCPFADSMPSGSYTKKPEGAAHNISASQILSTMVEQMGAVAPQVLPTVFSALHQMSNIVNPSGPPTTPSAPPRTPPTSAPQTLSSNPHVSGDAPPHDHVADPNEAPAKVDTPPEPMVVATDANVPTTYHTPPAKPVEVSEPDEETKEEASTFEQMIDRQLLTMLNMGFNNEGSWLRDLLATNNGDIARVLDILGGNKTPLTLSKLELD